MHHHDWLEEGVDPDAELGSAEIIGVGIVNTGTRIVLVEVDAEGNLGQIATFQLDSPISRLAAPFAVARGVPFLGDVTPDLEDDGPLPFDDYLPW